VFVNRSPRGGPIIWPLRAKLRQLVFLQQRPRSTGGLPVPLKPIIPWDRPRIAQEPDVVHPLIINATDANTAWTVNLSDTITLSDAENAAVGKTLSDTVTLTDANAKSAGKVQSDTITLSDSSSKSSGIFSLSDTITLSDDQSKADGKAIDDTITLSDFITVTPSGGVNYTVNLSDTITLSDAASVVVPPQPAFPPVFLSGGGTEIGHPRMKALKPELKRKCPDYEIEELEIVAILTCWLGKN